MPRPVILGIVGDSAAGKTTISGALVDILGDEQVTHVGTDDYHKYDREQRKEVDITPLHPDCNYMDIIAQHLALLREGEPILKPVYKHKDGTFGSPEYIAPKSFAVVEGLLGYHTEGLRDSYDVRVFLAPPEAPVAFLRADELRGVRLSLLETPSSVYPRFEVSRFTFHLWRSSSSPTPTDVLWT